MGCRRLSGLLCGKRTTAPRGRHGSVDTLLPYRRCAGGASQRGSGSSCFRGLGVGSTRRRICEIAAKDPACLRRVAVHGDDSDGNRRRAVQCDGLERNDPVGDSEFLVVQRRRTRYVSLDQSDAEAVDQARNVGPAAVHAEAERRCLRASGNRRWPDKHAPRGRGRGRDLPDRRRRFRATPIARRALNRPFHGSSG
jgi:hypothetical protein